MSLPRSQGERGVITAMFAVLAIFFFLIVSVVAEGGRKLSNLSLAEDVAAEAARAAAATLNLDRIANGVAEIDGVDNRAEAEAQKVVDAVPGATIDGLTIATDSVTVIVRVHGDSLVPGLNIDGVGRHRALAYDPFD